jgi:TM2 domain-containing membrane protein YozV
VIQITGAGLEPDYIVGMNRAGIAGVLSLIVPGVGQIYNGDFLRGIFWLIVTPGFWIGTGGFFGWVCHLIAAYTAYQRATEREDGFAAAR